MGSERNFGLYVLLTTSGFAGVGLQCTRGFRPGDKVALFNGVKAPLVLRDSGDSKTHIFVGAARVQGIMNGEAWDLAEKNLLNKQLFKII